MILQLGKISNFIQVPQLNIVNRHSCIMSGLGKQVKGHSLRRGTGDRLASTVTYISQGILVQINGALLSQHNDHDIQSFRRQVIECARDGLPVGPRTPVESPCFIFEEIKRHALIFALVKLKPYHIVRLGRFELKVKIQNKIFADQPWVIYPCILFFVFCRKFYQQRSVQLVRIIRIFAAAGNNIEPTLVQRRKLIMHVRKPIIYHR